MKLHTQSGYIGVFISILITVLILGFIFVQYMNAPSQTTDSDRDLQPLTASGTVPTNKIETYEADIDAANQIQSTVDTQTKKIHQTFEE